MSFCEHVDILNIIFDLWRLIFLVNYRNQSNSIFQYLPTISYVQDVRLGTGKLI